MVQTSKHSRLRWCCGGFGKPVALALHAGLCVGVVSRPEKESSARVAGADNGSPRSRCHGKYLRFISESNSEIRRSFVNTSVSTLKLRPTLEPQTSTASCIARSAHSRIGFPATHSISLNTLDLIVAFLHSNSSRRRLRALRLRFPLAFTHLLSTVVASTTFSSSQSFCILSTLST